MAKIYRVIKYLSEFFTYKMAAKINCIDVEQNYVTVTLRIGVQPMCNDKQQQQQPFNGLFSRTTWVSRYQKGKTNLDFTGARNSEWQWHQLGHMQVCTSLQTDNHASTPPL